LLRAGWAQDEDGLKIDGDSQEDGEKQVVGEQEKAAKTRPAMPVLSIPSSPQGSCG